MLSTKASQLSVIPGGKPEVVSDDLVGAVQRYVDAVVAPLREKIIVQQIAIEALKARPQPQIRGVIEWYDKHAIKVHRPTEPNILLLKDNVKYMYKENEDKDEDED